MADSIVPTGVDIMSRYNTGSTRGRDIYTNPADYDKELALYEGWITEEQVHTIGDELSMTLYGKYLQCL